MNKKPLVIALSLALGMTMFGAAAYANISSSQGYEVYKAAVKSMLPANSLTAQGSVSVSDNGTVILNASGTEKLDRADKTMSGTGTYTANNTTQSCTIYRQDGETIINNSSSDVYNVIKNDLKKFDQNRQSESSQSISPEVENIIDLLAANYDNNIALDSNSDGSKTVTLKLDGSQITPLQNALAQLAIKNANHEPRHAGTVIEGLPQLTDNINLQSVDITARVNDQGQITEQTAVIQLSGQDASGQTHELVINADLNLSGINSTVPDTVDLTGKQVVTRTGQHE
jgi:hypothetical protein